MKLYRVTVELEMYVAAKNDVEAEHVAEANAREEMQNGVSIGHVHEVTDKSQVVFPWELGSIPWGSENDKTIEGYLAETSPGEPA